MSWASLILAAAALSAAAMQSAQTTADRVYTTEQAARGRALYEATCQGCHGSKLTGGVGSALIGDRFMNNWNGITMDRLLERVRSMPPDMKTPREDGASLDLVAFILSANGFPAGGHALDGTGLEAIVIAGRGVEPIPNFSLVQVVGCLAHGSEREWFVNRATGPVRTKDPATSSGAERDKAAATPPGTATFQLLNAFPSPEAFAGHLVEAKGFLIEGVVSRLNVTALASLAPDCPTGSPR